MKKFCGTDHILKMAPRYKLHDTVKQRRFLVMEYLSDDVDDFIAKIP